MYRLEHGNFRALADERSHDLSRKNDQANGDASLKEMPLRGNAVVQNRPRLSMPGLKS